MRRVYIIYICVHTYIYINTHNIRVYNVKKEKKNTRSEQFSHCHAMTLYAQKDLYGVVYILLFFLWQN